MSLLQNHMRTTHNPEPTHICDVCAKSFKSAHSYEHHYEVEHSEVAQQKAQCEQCGKWFVLFTYFKKNTLFNSHLTTNT